MPSPADQRLLQDARAAGYAVSPTQLERWRTSGLVPRNIRTGLGRGRGSVSVVPEDALARLIAVAKSARQGRALLPDTVLARVVHGMPVPDAVVRSKVVRHLRRLVRVFALDRVGDQGWQARNDRARRHMRGAGGPPVLDMLLSAAHDDPSSDDGAGAWRLGAVLAHVMAGDGDGVTGEELAREMATAGGQRLSTAEVEQLVAEVRAGETAGSDLAEVMARLMSVHRLIEAAETVDMGVLKRALSAVWTVLMSHTVLNFQAFHEMVRREVGETELDRLLPESYRRLPEEFESLRQHPAWTWFAGTPLYRSRSAFSTTVAWLSMLLTLTRDELMLRAVEDYRDRLDTVMGL